MDSKVYIDDIRQRAATETHLQDLSSILGSPELDNTKASVIEVRTSGRSSHTGITSLPHFIAKVQELDSSWSAKQCQSPIAQRAARTQLVVVENPSPDFINFLGTYYEVSPEFFVEYAAGCRPQKRRIPPRLPSQSLRSSFLHVDGVQSYLTSDLIGNAPGYTQDTERATYLQTRRHYFKRKSRCRSGELELEDRVSYFVKSRGENDWIAICLIDPRLCPRRPSEQARALRLPAVDDGWQGNLFASTTSSLQQTGFSLHDAFTAYLANVFTLEEFVEDVFSPSIFLYLHSALTWNEAITNLTSSLKHLSFNQLSTPETMHRLQEIRSSFSYMSISIQNICNQLQHRSQNPSPFSDPAGSRRESWSSFPSCTRNIPIRSRFQDLHQDFTHLLHLTQNMQSLITETISISIATSNLHHHNIIAAANTANKDQAFSNTRSENVTTQTRLLSIYLPLIFGSLLFGMNVQEINSSGAQIGIFVIVALGLVGFTMVTIWVWELLDRFDVSLGGFTGLVWRRKGKVDGGMV